MSGHSIPQASFFANGFPKVQFICLGYVQQVARQLIEAAYRNTHKKRNPQTIKTCDAAQCMRKRNGGRAHRIHSASRISFLHLGSRSTKMKSTATRKIKWYALENVRLAYSAQLKNGDKSRSVLRQQCPTCQCTLGHNFDIRFDRREALSTRTHTPHGLFGAQLGAL